MGFPWSCFRSLSLLVGKTAGGVLPDRMTGEVERRTLTRDATAKQGRGEDVTVGRDRQWWGATMKVIFLDIDGVLNDKATWGPGIHIRMVRYPQVAEYLVDRLNRVIKATGAVVVLSTSWRNWPGIDDYLRARGLRGKIIGQTPTCWECGSGEVRWKEIQWWLTPRVARGEVTGYVILDDMPDFGPLSKHHVYTGPDEGILEKDIPRIINVLNERNLAV